MEKQFDTQAVMERAIQVAKELRKSDAYPAIIGGIAGGIAGTLMAVLIAGRRPSAGPSAPEEETSKSSKAISVREVMQLVPVIMSLVKQVQEWTQKQNEK
jgi:hypothetical protein